MKKNNPIFSEMKGKYKIDSNKRYRVKLYLQINQSMIRHTAIYIVIDNVEHILEVTQNEDSSISKAKIIFRPYERYDKNSQFSLLYNGDIYGTHLKQFIDTNRTFKYNLFSNNCRNFCEMRLNYLRNRGYRINPKSQELIKTTRIQDILLASNFILPILSMFLRL